LPVDITSGDTITPSAIRYGFKTLFDEEKSITLWAYNIETLPAEKVETVLRRGTLNSRLRGFYDICPCQNTKIQLGCIPAGSQSDIGTSKYGGTNP
jgi:hypothetical protein